MAVWRYHSTDERNILKGSRKQGEVVFQDAIMEDLRRTSTDDEARRHARRRTLSSSSSTSSRRFATKPVRENVLVRAIYNTIAICSGVNLWPKRRRSYSATMSTCHRDIRAMGTGLTWKGYFRKWREEATSRFLVNRQSRSFCGKLFRSSLVNQIQSS